MRNSQKSFNKLWNYQDIAKNVKKNSTSKKCLKNLRVAYENFKYF